MKFSTTLLLAFVVSATNAFAEKDVDEIIHVGKKPPAGAIIYAAPSNETPKEAPKDSKDSKDQNESKESKESKDKELVKEVKEVKETKETKEVKESDPKKNTNDSNNSKDPITGTQKDSQSDNKEDLGVPTRLFRPRYRNSAEAVAFSMKNFALISVAIVAGVLLL